MTLHNVPCQPKQKPQKQCIVEKGKFSANSDNFITRLRLKKVLPLPPTRDFADISYLEENFKPHPLRDICTLFSGALVSDNLLHMLL